jgi:ubiquinone/menaquinone biosynthesis C-methylase UbiE
VSPDPKRVVADGYDEIAERYAAWGDPTAGLKAKYVARALALAPEGAAALDLGCGTGEQVTRRLASRYRVTGVDISPRSIELARQVLPGATLLVADMADVQLPPASFDLVTAFFSLIHVPREEHATVLRRIAGWLRPGGHVIVSMSAGDGGTDTEPDWLGTPMYWSNWDAATNLRLIAEAGLQQVEATVETELEDDVPVRSLWIVAVRA